MGQAAPKAVTSKESGDGRSLSKCLSWGYSSMQGWRLRMEDAHFAIESLDLNTWADTACFGVLDGHGGLEVARFCEELLPSAIADGCCQAAGDAMVSAFQKMDELLVDEKQLDFLRSFTGDSRGGPNAPPLSGPDRVGCTAVVCLVQGSQIVVANAGDSRVLLSRAGLAIPLSEDHKPNLPVEQDRIHKAGGSVERFQVGPIVQFRINGNLNLSRSIGDLGYKKDSKLLPSEQIISSKPDLVTCQREAGDEFLLLACDGIWEVLGNQDAVDFVHDKLPRHREEGKPLSWIMEELLDRCLSPDLRKTDGLGGDNMTAMLVLLQGDKPVLSQAIPRFIQSQAQNELDDQMLSPAGFCSCHSSVSL